MSRSGAEIVASENRSKYIQSRISRIEHDFGEICESLSSYTRKTARIRDKGDRLCNLLREYADTELINLTTKTSLIQFADFFSTLQDYRQAQVSRLEVNVVKPLCAYGSTCKDAKIDIRATLSALEREQRTIRVLQKTSLKFPNDENLLYRARSDVDQATLQSLRTSKDLITKMDAFERKKVVDLKRILLDFIKIEMIFHSKSLEIYTNCYRAIKAINPDTDFAEYRRFFYQPYPTMNPDPTQVISATPMAQTDEALPCKTKVNLPQSVNHTPPSIPVDTSITPLTPSCPYGLVTTGGVTHYKMKDNIVSDYRPPTDSEADHVEAPKKKVTVNPIVDLVEAY